MENANGVKADYVHSIPAATAARWAKEAEEINKVIAVFQAKRAAEIRTLADAFDVPENAKFEIAETETGLKLLAFIE